MSELFNIEVVLGTTQLSLREVKALEKGSVIDLGVAAGTKVKCYYDDTFLIEGDVMVFERNLGIRVTEKRNNASSVPEFKPLEITHTKNQKHKKPKKYFKYLDKIDSSEIAEFIMCEHPQTIAVIISHIPSEKAAEILRLFTYDLGTEVIMRIAKMGVLSPSIISRVSSTLEVKVYELAKLKIQVGGVKTVSKIFNYLDTEVSQKRLGLIAQLDQELSESINQSNI